MSFHLCSLCLTTWHDHTPAPLVERRELLRPCPDCVAERGVPALEKAA